jgi:lipoprotein NlpI
MQNNTTTLSMQVFMFIFVSVNCITKLSCLSDTTDYYFQGTIITHNKSHKLKHEINIALLSDILLGFKLKDSTKKLLPSGFLGVSGFQLTV